MPPQAWPYRLAIMPLNWYPQAPPPPWTPPLLYVSRTSSQEWSPIHGLHTQSRWPDVCLAAWAHASVSVSSATPDTLPLPSQKESSRRSSKFSLPLSTPTPISYWSASTTTYLARNILSNQRLLIETEVFSSSLHEIFTAADDLSVEGVDDRVRFLEESVDPANFLKIQLPFRGVLDDYAEIDVAITTADPPGDLLTLTGKRDT